MLKPPLLKFLARLRGFMQREIVLEIRGLQVGLDGLLGELHRLGGEHEKLRTEREELLATLDRLHGEQEQLRITLDRLHGEHEGLRATLDRLDLFDQTARTVEDGLLTLALLREPENLSATPRADA